MSLSLTVLAQGLISAGGNPLTLVLPTSLWAAVTFLLCLAVLWKVAWGPILEGLKKREEGIDEALQAAEKAKEEVARLKDESAKIQDEAREEAKALLEEARKDADDLRSKLQTTAKKEAEEMVERAKKEVSLARDHAVEDVKKLAVDLSMEIASRIVRREVKPEDQARLVEESLGELEGRFGKPN